MTIADWIALGTAVASLVGTLLAHRKAATAHARIDALGPPAAAVDRDVDAAARPHVPPPSGDATGVTPR